MATNAAGRSRCLVAFGLSLGLAAVTAAPATAQPMKFRNAQVETLSFDKLEGWKADNQAAAFAAYLKSCGAILNATPAMRKARPLYGGLYNACRSATVVAASGSIDNETARKFFEDNFKPVRIKPPERTYG